MEKLKCAAIKYKDLNGGEWHIEEGMRHAYILLAMHDKGVTYDKLSAVQGFMTTSGRFVDRVEAIGIAIAAKQVTSQFSKDELRSEDVW